MLKVVRKHRSLFLLPGLWLMAAILIHGEIGALTGSSSIASAAVLRAPSVTDCTGEYQRPSFGSPVVVNSGEVICSPLTSFGGTVAIQGEVRGDVVSFGGNVVISGQVDGNVTLYNGNVTLQEGATINGDVHVCGGQWIVTGSSLRGSVFDCTKSVGQLILSGDGGPGFHLWSLLTWLALGLLLITLLPEHVMLVGTTIRSKPRRSVLLGLLSILLTPPVLAVLIALIISIPLAIIVSVGLIAAWTLGTIATGWLVGEQVVRTFAPHQNTRTMQIIVGLTLLVLAESLPYVGLIISIGAGLLGIGAVFLSRFGTRLYAQPKQPLPL